MRRCPHRAARAPVAVRLLLGAIAFASACSSALADGDLPPEYRAVEWIESTGTQMIDTEHVFKGEALVVADMMLMTAADKDVAGVPNNSGPAFIVDYTGTKLYYRYASTERDDSADFPSIVGRWVAVEWGVSAKHDGVVMSTATHGTDFSANTQTFRLFGARSGSYSSVRFKRVKMYDAGELVRDLQPVFCVADGQAGMYDFVRGKYHFNAGSGAFKYAPPTLQASDVIRLDWLESTGTQFIDTGVVFTNTPLVEARMMLRTDADKDVAGTAEKKPGCFIVDYKGNTLYYRYSSETYVQSAFASIVDTWVDCSWGPSAKHGDAVVSTCSTWDFSANSQTFRLFGARSGTFSSVRFGPVAMWDGDEFVRDLVPVRLRLCGQLGCFDRLSGAFYSNMGSGDFLPGPDATTPDELLVSADRAEVGSPSPAYGAVYDLAPGDAFTCTAPSETIPGEPGFRYACTGWTLYTNAADGASLLAWRSGRGQSLDYVHPGRFVKLEWNWSVERDPTRWSSDSYAQDGLVAQWDGWENAGRAAPHDPAAAMWVDLSGNGHTLGSFVSGSGWTTNAFTLPNSGYSVASKIVGAPLVSTQVVSMEIVYREIYRRNTATLLFAVAGSGSTGWKGFTWYDTWIGFQTGGSGWTFSQPRSYPQPIRTLYVGYPSAESAAADAFWADGVQMSARSGSDTWNQSHTGFGYTANANWAMQGEVYSVRVYNRKLTDDEIRRHSRIDDFRFRGVVHGDELHVASAMGEYGTANPAYGSVSYGHVAGEEVVCTAPEEHDPGDGSYHARCTGYNLYTNVPGGDAWFPWTSGSASTCVFQFPESSVKVEWTWKVEAPKRLDFNGVAAVTTSSALLALEIGGYGAEADSAKLMVAWGFAPDALAFTNVLLETAVPATSFDALEFGGLFPGSEIHARIFLLDDLGGVVEQSGPPFSFTTASDSVPTAADYAPGLVAMWDGVENLGPGLGDLSARKWFDHVGDVDLDLIGSGAFTGDGLSMNGPSAVGAAAAPPFRAMELVLHEDSRSVAYAVPFASGINNLLVERANTKDGFIFEAGADSMMLPVPFDAAALRTWSANYNESRHVSRTFLDGAYAANGTHKDTWGSQDKVVCVGAYKRSDTGYPFRGTMHSIRLYDHELTDAEIARNRAVDVARFVSKNPVYEVRSAQREYGVVYPDWGAHAGLAAGGSVKFYAPDMALPGGLRVHARGCRIYRADASRADWRLDSEVYANSFEFFQGNSSARVVWDWLVQGPDGLEAPEQTAATDASADLAVRVVGFGFDATNAALSVAWGFEPGVYPFTNVLAAAALPGTTCTNVLAGLAPAARYHGSFFLVDSDGRLAAETPDFEFSTASRPPVPGLDLDALPDGSRILEWVEFNGSTYVDTGIVPSGHEVRMTYETTTWVNDGYVFGTDDGSTYMHWTEYASNGQLASALYYWGCNNAQYNWGHVAVNVVHDLDFNLKNGSAYETWLDGEKTSFNALSRSSKTLQIARRGSSGVKWKGRVYGFSMLAHATGEEVLRYFPASDPAGKACFWDAVARAFVYPASGTLAAGPAVVTAADSALVVTGWPLEYGAPAPGYGSHLFADGSRVAAWAGDFADGTFRAEVLGCNVYVNALGVWEFAEWKEGRSFELAQSGSGVKLEWRFMARDLPRLEFNGVVETNATAATLAVDVGGWGFAASNASLCVAWGFRPDELLYTNVLVDAAWAGLSTNVVFGGRAPGSRYYARVFLRDSEGGVVETADPEPFTFKTPRSGTGGGGKLEIGENLIQNPSFEANQDWSKNSYAYASATKQPAGWSFSTGSGLAWSGATWNAGGLPDGNYAAYVQMNGWAKTTVEVPRRAVYGFSYWYVRRANQPVGHKITVSVDGVEITNVTIVAANNTFVKLPEIELVLTAGAHEIFFQGYTAGSDITTCIDLVDLHAVRSLDDEVEVIGNPREYGEPNPDYGTSDGIAAGEAFTVQAYDFTDGTLEAKVKGYVVYTNDVSSGTRGVYLSGMREDLSVGNGFSCPYVHQDGYCGTVEWLWSVHDVPGLVFNDVVETNTANATLDVEISGWGYTGESAQLKMAYGFSPDFLQYTNVLWDAVVPRTATNIFATGFIPGQHYFLRLFLEADDGTIVDCGVTRELETPAEWAPPEVSVAGYPGLWQCYVSSGNAVFTTLDWSQRKTDRVLDPKPIHSGNNVASTWTSVDGLVTYKWGGAAGTSSDGHGVTKIGTWGWYGYMWFDDVTYTFGGAFDDSAVIKLDNAAFTFNGGGSGWTTADWRPPRGAGWYVIEIQVGDGGGGWGGWGWNWGLAWNTAGYKTKDNTNNWKPFKDPGDGSLLRTDAGYLPGVFLVQAAPSNYESAASSPCPYYGSYQGLAEGDSFIATMPFRFDDGRALLTTMGWEISTNVPGMDDFVLRESGSGTNALYRHGATAGKLVWIFEVSNHLEVAANIDRRGDVAWRRQGESEWHEYANDFNVLFGTNEVVTLRALPSPGTAGSPGYSFRKWSGELPSGVNRTARQINVRMDAPRRIVANFDAPYSIGATSEARFRIDGYTGSEALENFPVPVRLSEAAMEGFDYAYAADGGEDLRFFDQYGEPLPHEVENWNPDGESVAWVSVPRLDNDVEITMMYGDGQSAEGVSPEEVWSRAGYKAVWHMNQESKEQADATGNDAMTATTTSDVLLDAGVIGPAVYKTATLTAPNIHANAGVNAKSYTISGWYYWPDNSASAQWSHPFLNGNWNTWSWYLEYSYSNYSLRFIRNTAATGYFNTLDSSKYWNYMSISYNGSKFDVYLNGVRNTTASQSWTAEATTESLRISDFKGWVDETRVRDKVSSADWIKAEYEFATNGARAACLEVVSVGGGGETIYVGVDPAKLKIGGDGFVPAVGENCGLPVVGNTYSFAAPSAWTSEDGQLMGVRRGFVVRREDGWCFTNRVGGGSANRQFTEMEEFRWQYDVFHGLVETNSDHAVFGFTASGFVPPDAASPTGVVYAVWGYTPETLVNHADLAVVTTGAHHRCVLNGLEPEHSYAARVYFRLPDGTVQEDPHGLYRFRTSAPAFGGLPGLYQALMASNGGAAWSTTKSSFNWDAAVVDRMLGVEAALRGNTIGSMDWKSLDGSKTFTWSSKLSWAYKGYMWMDGGKTYTFGGSFDDYVQVIVNGQKIVDTGACAWGSGNFKPPSSGWYTIDVRLGDNGGYSGPNNASFTVGGKRTAVGYNTSGVTSANGTSWSLLQDPGNGTLLRTEPGLGGIEIVAENVVDGKLVSVDLAFGAVKAAGALWALSGPVAGTENTNTWLHVEKVGSLAVGATSFTAPVTNLWGAADRRVMCFYYQTASETLGTANLYFRDYRAPLLDEIAFSGLGGDTLNVSGRLKSFEGPWCDLRVLVGDRPEAPDRVWSGFPGARRNKARSFNFDLFEADRESPLFFRAGQTYYCCVEAVDTFGRVSRSKVLEVDMKAESAFKSATLAELNRRTAKWNVSMSELGACALDTVSLWIGSESATNELGEADESLFTQPIAAQPIVDGNAVSFQYVFPELEKDYFWQFRSANASQGGTTNWEVRTEPVKISTKDTTTYTWKRAVREGRWDDPRNWTANTADSLGWPGNKSCSVTFESGTEAVIHCPTNVEVYYVYFDSKRMKLRFDAEGAPAGTRVSFHPSRFRFFNNTSNNTAYYDEIEFAGLDVRCDAETDWFGAAEWRVRFTEGATFNYPRTNFLAYNNTANSPYGPALLEILDGSSATFREFDLGGLGRVVISNATMTCTSGFYLNMNLGGGTVRFEGTNPVLRVATNFRGWNNATPTNCVGGCEFRVPAGGYLEPPIQLTTGSYQFGGGNSDSASSKPVTFRVDPSSPAAWTDETLVCPLVAWYQGVNTNRVSLQELPNAETDELLLSSPACAEWTATNSWDAAWGVPTGMAVRIVGSSRKGRVTVVGWPFDVGGSDPGFSPRTAAGSGYGVFDDLTHDVESFVAPASVSTADMFANCVGVKLYQVDPITRERVEIEPISASANEIEFSRTNGWNEIEWQWEVLHRVRVSVQGSGSVSGSELWVKHGEAPADLLATPNSGSACFYRWTARTGSFDLAPPDAMKTNFLAAVTEPLELVAEFGKCIYVKTNGVDSANGLSPDTAKKTVLNAYNAAADGDRVVIFSGSYNFYSANNDNDILKMTKAVTLASESGDPASVLLYQSGHNRRVVRLQNAGARLQDLTVRYGGTSVNSERGANVCIDTQGGIVDHCVVRDGTCTAWGSSTGGISCYGANGYVFDTVISNNTAGTYDFPYGMGVYMEKGLMRGCTVVGNYAAAARSTGYNGAVYLTGSARMENCLVVGNRARTYAGVFIAGDSTATVDGCTFWENEVAGDIEAEHRDVYYGPESRFTNCKARKRFDENWTAIGGVVDESLDFSIMPTPSKIVQGAKVRFTPNAETPPGLQVVAFTYDFGDRVQQNNGAPGDGRTIPPADHVYLEPGVWSPRLSVLYDDDSTRSFTLENGVTVFPTNMYVRTDENYSTSFVPEFPYDDPIYNAHTNLRELVDMAIDGCTITIYAPNRNSGTRIPIRGSVLDVQRAVTIRGNDPDHPERYVLYRPSGDYRLIRLDHPQARLEHLCISNASHTGWGEPGSAVWMQGYGGVVSNCIVRDTAMANSDSAVYANGLDSVVTRCVITNNVKTAVVDAGAVALYVDGGARVDNCLVVGNQLNVGSGTDVIPAVYVNNGWLVNCTVVNNVTRRLGGVYVNGTTGRIVNSVILGNVAQARTEEYNDVDPAQASAYFNCVTSAELPYNDTCVRDDPWNAFNDWGKGDLTPSPAGSLHETGARTINQGTEAPIGRTDFAGNPRVVGRQPDIGCFECQKTNTFQIGFSVSEEIVAEGGELVLTPHVIGGKMTDVFEYWWDPTTYGFNDQLKNIIYTTEGTNVVWRYTGVGYKTLQLKVTKNRGKWDEETQIVKREDLVYVTPESIYVDQESRYPSYPYSTWASAATNLEEAVSIARTGAKVTVAPGLYEIKNPLALKHAITLRGSTGDPHDVVVRMGTVSGKDYLLLLSNAKAVVTGVTLDGGARNGRYNGGVYVDYGGGCVSNCVVENCWENRAWADTGAAWFCRASSGVLSHSVVQNCRLCANNGTKAVLQSSAGRVSNVLVRDCRVDSGLNYPIVRSSSLWDNCTVVDNSLEGGTMNGRVHLRVESALGGFRNCVFANNSANSKRELMVSLGSSTNLFNAADCDQPVGSGCIQIDEDRYRDFFLDQPAGNYRASARSPIKNGGDESAADLPQIDLDGRPRWVGKKPDVGCYESVTPDGLLLIFK